MEDFIILIVFCHLYRVPVASTYIMFYITVVL